MEQSLWSHFSPEKANVLFESYNTIFCWKNRVIVLHNCDGVLFENLPWLNIDLDKLDQRLKNADFELRNRYKIWTEYKDYGPRTRYCWKLSRRNFFRLRVIACCSSQRGIVEQAKHTSTFKNYLPEAKPRKNEEILVVSMMLHAFCKCRLKSCYFLPHDILQDRKFC